MKDSEILREARKLIEDGQENYICHALQDIGINHPECYDQTESIQNWIKSMFEYCELEEAGWMPWLGSETPPKTCSEVMFRSKGTDRPSCVYRWDHRDLLGDIIAHKP